MINLLPDDHKTEIRAGRTNVILRRYISLACGAAFLLMVFCGGTYYIVSNTNNEAKSKIAENSAAVASFRDDKQQATEFKANLEVAKKILSNDKSYSMVALNIARVLPTNIVLDNLTLSPEFFNKSFALTAKGKSYQDAIALKTAFQQAQTKPVDGSAPQPYFKDVSIQSVASGESSEQYPFSIVINATPTDGIAQP